MVRLDEAGGGGDRRTLVGEMPWGCMGSRFVGAQRTWVAMSPLRVLAQVVEPLSSPHLFAFIQTPLGHWCGHGRSHYRRRASDDGSSAER